MWVAAFWLAAVAAVAGPPGRAAAQSISVGVRGGINRATVAWSETPLGSELEELERRDAFTGGAWVAVPVAGRLGVRAELLWAGKGFVERDAEGATTLEVSYVEVPMLLTLAVPVGSGRLVPELFAGPWVGHETGCDVAFELEATVGSFACDEIPDEPILRQKTDWGYAIGGALALRGAGPIQGLLDVRYTAGIRNIDASPSVDNLDIRHRGVSVMLGLGVEVGR
jgi:hypothetical protein